MRIEVEPQALIDAGKQVGSLGVQLGALSDAMGQVLASGIASGADPAGLNFGISYGRQADQFGQYLAQAANAFKNVGLMLEATGYNYQHADQASVAGGSGPSGSVSGEPAETTAGDAPYGPNGSIVTPPTKYHLITPFIRLIPAFGMAAGVAMTWPSGNSGMMNVTAAQWRNIGQGLKVFESALSGAKAAVGAQDIPEGATITTALSDLGSGTTTLAGVADGLATSISDFAAGVLETQDAIRDLLDRISLDGLWDTVTGLLSGDGDRVLREIADDVSTVLENFQNQVKGVLGLLEELATLLGEAADAFQKWIRPVLVETFGEDAGNALADGIKLFTDIQVGGATGLIALVSGTVALADPDTWKGIADTALMVAKDPSLIDDVLKQMGSEFIALDEWQGDNPGRGFGEAAVNVASLFVPGGALAKGGAVAKGLAATRNLLQRGELGSLGRLPGLGGGRTPDAPELPDVPGVPDVPEFTPPPGIPGSVLGPGGPSSSTPSAPTSPGSGSGGGPAPIGPSPNGSGPSHSGGGAGPGGSSSNGPAPTGGSPSADGSRGGPSSNGPVPTGGSPSPDGGDGPSKPSGGAPVSPPMSPPGDSPGPSGPSQSSSGPNPSGGGDGPGSGSSDGGGSNSGEGSSDGGHVPYDSSPNGSGSDPNGDQSGATDTDTDTDNGAGTGDNGTVQSGPDGHHTVNGHPPPPPGHSAPEAIDAAQRFNDAFVNGQSTADLARAVSDWATHRVEGADRVVLGRWDGQDGGYIGEARHNGGGIYFDTGDEAWNAVEAGLGKEDAKSLGWQVNEQFLRTQLENGVGRIDYLLDHDLYDSLEDMAVERAGSFSQMEVEFLSKHAPAYGYERVGDSWVKVKDE
ncbi:PE domain-containing protein [Mycolicibacterium frederiksbergense]|uniref:PE domain-containing protein n=1 Tax=Mycolicibacterium frederiksbergense TaxID=117567 RepID=A0A6H0S7N3_9MYCO|nr:PE domain-containing protein [Mycolicibacterium frederiksbergense]QIV82439.1 PE domain-containing protein [Mycolicibacterium frederiksbergense]